MIDNRLDFGPVEHPVHAFSYKIHDGDGRRYFMTHDDIKVEHHVFRRWCITKVGCEYLLSYSFSH